MGFLSRFGASECLSLSLMMMMMLIPLSDCHLFFSAHFSPRASRSISLKVVLVVVVVVVVVVLLLLLL